MNDIEKKSEARELVSAEREGPVPVRSYVMKKRRAHAWLNKNARGVVRVKPGKRAKEPTPQDPAIRKKGKALLGVLIAVAALLVMLPAVFAVASQFVISAAEAEGATLYSAEEILSASGLSEGDSTLTLNRKEAAASVKKNLPNVKSCAVRIDYPGTVIFEIEEHAPAAAIEADDGRQYVVNSGLLVLKRAGEEETDGALITVTPAAISECLVGKELSFADPMDARSLEDALNDIAASGLDTAGARLDATDRYRMTLTLADGTEILLGSKGDLGIKLATAERLILDGTGAGATIDVSVPSCALVRAGN